MKYSAFLIPFIFSFYAHAGEGIKVISAKWGSQDVTPQAAGFCDHKNVCKYKISSKFITKPTGDDQSFSISWLCHDLKETTTSKKIDGYAEGHLVTLTCAEVAPLPEVQVKLSDSKIDSQTTAYYKKLIEKYNNDPGSVYLDNFTKTFYPMEEAPTEDEDQLLICTRNIGGQGCKDPDTFYSWGHESKMNNIKLATSLGHWGEKLNENHYVYMNQSSVGSYCYGEYPVRFKFKQTPERGLLNHGTYGDSSTYNEWITEKSDPKEIESVSFARPEHIDEIITEIKRRLDPAHHWYEGALYVLHNSDNRAKIYEGCVPEVLSLSEDNLVHDVIRLIKAYFDGQSWLHTPTCEENCNPTQHFKTKWKTFYNPS
jgi:hypothetical protein